MKWKKKTRFFIFMSIVALISGLVLYSCCIVKEKIGVIFVVHSVFGEAVSDAQSDFDSMVTMFSYDHNHPVNKIIWNPQLWGIVAGSEMSIKMGMKYDFMYERLGGPDPFQTMSDLQLADLKAELDKKGWLYCLEFEVEFACWTSSSSIAHYPYPRFIYYGPDGPDEGYNCTYCGEAEEGGPWEGCDPDRYNIDGPVERLLNKGVSRIIMIDLTVGGVRFAKTYEVVQMTKRALNAWNEEHETSIPLMWVNDYTNLMERSFPTEPEGWTRTLGPPEVDQEVPLEGSPNPIAEDPLLATLHVEAIEAVMSDTVSDADAGVVILNHALHDNNECFDPKIDDTLIVNKNIKSQLLERHPTMDPDNIIGAYMGIQELNPENDLVERTREMRGEDVGHAYLYESDKQLPGDEWGYLYWDALEYLKNRGVKHIVIGFTQIVVSSTYDLVEFPNQIGKEIGIKNWAKWDSPDHTTYPGVGHPFADYWGNWVDTNCGEWEIDYDSGTSEFTAGATLTGQTSGATGVIKWLTGDATSGILTLKEVSGTFQDGETITDDKGGSAVVSGSATLVVAEECCFEMGGCDDPLRPYPPPRQAPLNKKRGDLDPSLAYGLCEYGHLGYDPALGAPDSDGPVQDQYTGTWEIYIPPNDDPRIGEFLAKYVLNAALGELE